MTGDEMAALLKRIGWPSSELARRLHVNVRSVAAWLAGKRPIPDNLADWLRQVGAHMEQAPALPDGWVIRPPDDGAP